MNLSKEKCKVLHLRLNNPTSIRAEKGLGSHTGHQAKYARIVNQTISILGCIRNTMVSRHREIIIHLYSVLWGCNTTTVLGLLVQKECWKSTDSSERKISPSKRRQSEGLTRLQLLEGGLKRLRSQTLSSSTW